MDERRRRAGRGRLLDVRPEPREEADVVADLALGRTLAGRPHDEAVAGLALGLDGVAKAVALLAVLDPPRDPDVVRPGHVHEIATRQGDVGGDARALRPDRLLRHLDEQLLAFLETFLDRRELDPSSGRGDVEVVADLGVAVLGLRLVDDAADEVRPGQVGDVEERGLLEPDLDERRLHARQDAHDATLVDVSREAAILPALGLELDERRLLQDGHPRLPRRRVDQNLPRHARGAASCAAGQRSASCACGCGQEGDGVRRAPPRSPCSA